MPIKQLINVKRASPMISLLWKKRVRVLTKQKTEDEDWNRARPFWLIQNRRHRGKKAGKNKRTRSPRKQTDAARMLKFAFFFTDAIPSCPFICTIVFRDRVRWNYKCRVLEFQRYVDFFWPIFEVFRSNLDNVIWIFLVLLL